MSEHHRDDSISAKGEFRRVLQYQAGQWGLTSDKVEMLVQRSEFIRPNRRERFCSSDDCTDFVKFLVTGLAKVVCTGSNRRSVIAEFIGPGRFFCPPLMPRSPHCCHVEMFAHVPSVVALMRRDVIDDAIASLSPGNAPRVIWSSRQFSSQLLYEKCALLGMRRRDQVAYELVRLAFRFGRPEGNGVLIEPMFTAADIASLIGGSRMNVSRHIAALCRAGLLERVGRRILVTRRLIDRVTQVRPCM